MQGDRRDMARARLAELMRDALAQAVGRVPAPTLDDYFATWMAARVERGIASVKDDESRYRTHVKAWGGHLHLDEFHPRTIREYIRAMWAKHDLAPRTVRHVYALLHGLFRCAVADELIETSPCLLAPGDVPPNVDADPMWRHTAAFCLAEVEAIITDERIPWYRRVLYALKVLAGLRHREAATLKRSQLEPRDPLWAALLGHTKAKRPRPVPIHPTLQWVLDGWFARGYVATYGHTCGADDLVVPSLGGTVINASNAQREFLGDLARLGLRRRRGHDLRRTFISLALADGARKDVLRWISHGPSADVMDLYTTLPWPALCAEVLKLRVEVGQWAQLELFASSCHGKKAGPAGSDPATDGLKDQTPGPQGSDNASDSSESSSDEGDEPPLVSVPSTPSSDNQPAASHNQGSR